VGRHVAPLGHIISIPSQPFFIDIDDTIRLGAPYDIDATVISLVPKTVKIKY
jgi:hypothetical protein